MPRTLMMINNLFFIMFRNVISKKVLIMVVGMPTNVPANNAEFNQIMRKWMGTCVHLWDGATVYEREATMLKITRNSYGSWILPLLLARGRPLLEQKTSKWLLKKMTKTKIPYFHFPLSDASS